MKRWIFCLTILSIFACLNLSETAVAFARTAHQPKIEAATEDSATMEKKQKDCDVLVQFGSYGGGTDAEVEGKVTEAINKSDDVAKAKSWSWGIEGDSSICITAKKGKADAIYEELTAMIPAESKKGYTTVRHKDGRQKQTVWPK